MPHENVYYMEKQLCGHGCGDNNQTDRAITKAATMRGRTTTIEPEGEHPSALLIPDSAYLDVDT